jgi:hypothetical protein
VENLNLNAPYIRGRYIYMMFDVLRITDCYIGVTFITRGLRGTSQFTIPSTGSTQLQFGEFGH